MRRNQQPLGYGVLKNQIAPVFRGQKIVYMIKNIYPISNTKLKMLVVFDDGRTIAVVKSALKEYNVKEGDNLSFEKVSEIAGEGEAHEAFLKAADALGRSPKSEKEIRTALKDKGYSKAAADVAVEKLTGYGYLSDEDYAKTYIEHYSKKLGRKKLVYELVQTKGLPSDVASEIVYGALSDEDELRLALELAGKFLKKKDGKDNLKQKCLAFLASRGIDFQTALKATETLIKEEDDYA